MTSGPQLISSRDNPLLKELRRLAQDSTGYRKQGRIWLEGDHLCRAVLDKGLMPELAVFAESSWGASPWALPGAKVVVVADALFQSVSGLESPAGMGFVMPLPQALPIAGDAASVILDRVQDAGNVGAILRSAAAFGFRQVIALKGTAALWSPKVLRAGMGAHFSLALNEAQDLAALNAVNVPIITTSSHAGKFLHLETLPWPCAWAMGHEGQGVGAELAARASLSVRIAQPGGEESLNVASAAAICLYASASAKLASTR